MNERSRFFFLTVSFVVAGSAVFSGPPAWADYQAKGKRDPFVPLLTPEGQRIHPPGLDEEATTGLTGLILQGIIFDRKAESYAIINGRIVGSREQFDGMEVLRVEPTAVTVLVGGQQHRLTLQQPKKEEKQVP